jgi:hypothetical protein
MDRSSQDTIVQCDAIARQAAVDKIDCHDGLRREAMGILGRDWKEASLSKLRAFLMTRSIEE